MTHYDDRRKRSVETPLGPRQIIEKKWNEGDEDEHWAYVQEFKYDFDDETLTAEIVGEMLVEYSIVRQLASGGYEFHSMLSDSALLWINYTSNSNDNSTNQD